MTRHKVYVYPADKWACGYFRLGWPGEFCGGDVEVVYPGERSVFGGMVDQAGQLRKAVVAEDAAAVVIQRPTYRWVAQAVPMLREQGVAVVVDMDDDLAAIHPANPAFAMMHPNMGDPNHSWHHAAQACRDATLVTCSTEALVQRYAPHGRGVVLDNYPPKRYLEVEHQDNEMITWCGSLHSHPNDLSVLGAAVANLCRDAGAKYQSIGSGTGVDRALGLYIDGLLPPTGTVEFDDWPRAVTSSGITLAPLADTKFNEAKSWLKPLEAMAAGVPVVMSPRREYARLHRETDVGFLCEKPKQWEAVLRKLLRDPALRREQSEAGRAVVKERYVLEDQAWQWAEAWQWAIDYERGRVSTGT